MNPTGSRAAYEYDTMGKKLRRAIGRRRWPGRTIGVIFSAICCGITCCLLSRKTRRCPSRPGTHASAGVRRSHRGALRGGAPIRRYCPYAAAAPTHKYPTPTNVYPRLHPNPLANACAHTCSDSHTIPNAGTHTVSDTYPATHGDAYSRTNVPTHAGSAAAPYQPPRHSLDSGGS